VQITAHPNDKENANVILCKSLHICTTTDVSKLSNLQAGANAADAIKKATLQCQKKKAYAKSKKHMQMSQQKTITTLCMD
jgi:hypothetical protein